MLGIKLLIMIEITLDVNLNLGYGIKYMKMLLEVNELYRLLF